MNARLTASDIDALLHDDVFLASLVDDRPNLHERREANDDHGPIPPGAAMAAYGGRALVAIIWIGVTAYALKLAVIG